MEQAHAIRAGQEQAQGACFRRGGIERESSFDHQGRELLLKTLEALRVGHQRRETAVHRPLHRREVSLFHLVASDVRRGER